DLYRYTGQGTLSPRSPTGYFSFDSGKTVVNTFSRTDPGDWVGTTPDAFNQFASTNDPITTGDLEVMHVIGFALNNPGLSGKTLSLGSTAATVLGSVGDTIIGGSGTAIINATAGSQSIVGGSGAVTIFGGNGDTIVAGSGDAYVDGTKGGQTIF